jgi:hypothetical protein
MPPVHVHGKGDASRSVLTISLLAGAAMGKKRRQIRVIYLLVVGRINATSA